jgi:hypothetical protein
MRYSTFQCCLAVVLLALIARADVPAPRFELRDQFGSEHEVEFPCPRVSVLVFADRQGCGQLEDWVRPLYERYGDSIDIHGVAKLKGVPSLLRPLLRSMFRNRLDYPVMMDWTGAVSTNYNYEASMANILVLSPAGRIEYRFNGTASPSELEQCFDRIDGLLEASSPRAGQPARAR